MVRIRLDTGTHWVRVHLHSPGILSELFFCEETRCAELCCKQGLKSVCVYVCDGGA